MALVNAIRGLCRQLFGAIGVALCLTLNLGCGEDRAGDGKKEKAPIELRVIPEQFKDSRHSSGLVRLRVAMTNNTSETIAISWNIDPILQYLTLDVTKSDGKIARESFSDLTPHSFEPLEEALEPRQTITALSPRNIGFEGPGVYRVQVIWEYKGLKAVSEPVTLELKNIGK